VCGCGRNDTRTGLRRKETHSANTRSTPTWRLDYASSVAPRPADDEVNALLIALSPGIGFYAGTIALAIVAPRLAAVGYLVIAVVGVLRVRGDQPAAQPT
jgi:hypothetical protein